MYHNVPTVDEPDDFDDFWQRTVSGSARPRPRRASALISAAVVGGVRAGIFDGFEVPEGFP